MRAFTAAALTTGDDNLLTLCNLLIHISCAGLDEKRGRRGHLLEPNLVRCAIHPKIAHTSAHKLGCDARQWAPANGNLAIGYCDLKWLQRGVTVHASGARQTQHRRFHTKDVE